MASDAVIFDLDGCLVDSEPHSLEAVAAEMRRLGVRDATAEEIGARFLGVSMSVICDHVSTRLGAACPPDFPDRVEVRLFAAYRSSLAVMPGALGLLGAVDEAGLRKAIATGGSPSRMRRTLEMSGLEARFRDRAFSAAQVKRGKPAPDLFLFCARQLGVAPRSCVVFEDSPHGVAGAAEAGMRVIGFIGGSHLDDRRETHAKDLLAAGAERVLYSLDEGMAAIGAEAQ